MPKLWGLKKNGIIHSRLPYILLNSGKTVKHFLAPLRNYSDVGKSVSFGFINSEFQKMFFAKNIYQEKNSVILILN